MSRDGRQLHVSLTVSPVYDSQNRLIGISKIARDVSERIAMEHEIRDQVRQREAFLATLSHELRNPLAAALNASRLIRDERTTEPMRKQAAEIVERQISMTRTLLVDLLDMSRISQGKIEFQREKVDLCGLLDTVRETVQSDISRHARNLVCTIPDHPLIVLGDAIRLVQVLVNLISNAAKYSPADTDVHVSITRDEDWAVVAVTDEGVGIPQDQLKRIFDPFVQISETQGQSDGGLGVGLTLVKALVEEHGGRVEASSQGLGNGSTFRIWLPAIDDSLENSPQAQQSMAVVDNKKTESRRIVLIEDIDDSRRMLSSLLTLEGHLVHALPDGESGVDAIAEHHPDLALVDIGLPGIDGYEVARRVRQDPNCRDTVLIALTGFGQRSDIENALAAGFDSHLVKPIDPDQLAELIQKRCRAAHP